jgi:hypothetical protein
MHFQGEHAEKLVQPESKGMGYGWRDVFGKPLGLAPGRGFRGAC